MIKSWRTIMVLTFAEYCLKQNSTLAEMAQSRDPAKGKVHLDDSDKDFIAQATQHERITPQSAIRARYTTLLQDKVQDGGNVRFPVSDRRRFVSLPIARTHLDQLQEKLRAAGFEHAAENGLHPNDPAIPHGSVAFYEKAFGRQNAVDVLKNGALDINNKQRVGKRVTLTRNIASQEPGAEGDAQNPSKTQSVNIVTNPVSNTWANSHIQKLFGDKSRAKDHVGMMGLKELPAANGDTRKMYDFSAIWRELETIVGDTSQPDKHILPEVWNIFKSALPNVGEVIYQGVRRKLMQFSPDSLADPMEVNHAMLQATAMILSEPVRAKTGAGRDGDFIKNVERLLTGNGGTLASYAASKTAQGYVRNQLKINTNNTGNREYGVSADSTQVHGDQKGVQYNMDKEIDDKDSLSRGEDPDDHHYINRSPESELKEPEVKRPVAGENSPAARAIKAKMQAIEPQAQKVISKLDATNWNMSAVTDDEWEIYSKYEKLEKELERAKNAPVQDFENSSVPVAARKHFPKNEVAGASGTLGSLDRNNPDFQVEGDPCSQVVLGFNAWCKKRGGKKHK
jgi:hypothetical protein